MSVDDVLYAGWQADITCAGPSYWTARDLAARGREVAERAWREAEFVERRLPTATMEHARAANRRGWLYASQARDLFATSALSALEWLWGRP